jgi:CubicO group peptidase (beta-lactamase class C family)
MKKFLLTLACLVVWGGFVFLSAFYGLWMSPVVERGDQAAFISYATDRIDAETRGNTAFVLLRGGVPYATHFSDTNEQVNDDTVFSLASLSKWFAAYAILQLAQNGELDLDTPVQDQLSRWQLPESDFDLDGVTARALLSHTAGLADGLGFGDYSREETVPTLESSLAAPRASDGRKVEIALSSVPGEQWNYSGGGYLILELLVEETTSMKFADYLTEAVFEPLGMRRTGYDFIESYPNNAGSYSRGGARAESFRYASNAATALVSSTADLTRFVQHLVAVTTLPKDSEKKITRPLLTPEYLKQMREPHGHALGAAIWGLGTILYAPVGDDFVYGHDGANDPAINSSVRVNPVTGDAFIALTTGHPTLASNLGSDWVLWQTGVPDVLASDAVIESMLLPFAVGAILMLLLWAWLARRRRR